MFKSALKLVSYFFLASCHKILKPPVPDTSWKLFDSTAATPLPGKTRKDLEGVYAIEGEDEFGKEIVLKWSISMQGADAIHYLSMFCEEDAAYFICQGKELNDSILLNGYWRKAMNRETGRARFIIKPEEGAKDLLSNDSIKGQVTIAGTYGNDNKEPRKKIRLNYLRPLYNKEKFEIIAHRGGGRTGDLLPASENSVELIQLASRLGATGVEIDVQQSSDGVLVLYHDEKINNRLTRKTKLSGELKEHTYPQLASMVRLKNDERIPTLEAALEVIIHQTDLRYVWLDVKDTGYLAKTRELQEKALKAAAAAGRELEITIGIHDEKLYERFLSLPGYQNIPSLCELEPANVLAMNARIWAPIWTEGLQKEDVQKMQEQGKRVFVWTIDGDVQIDEFMNEANYDGIVSNHPSLVAYYFYTKQ